MTKATQRQTGELARKAFEVLLAHPEGLSFHSALNHIKQSFAFSRAEQNTMLSQFFLLPSEEIARLGMIAAIKAGWLNDQHGVVSVTDLGRCAYTRFQDPEEFMRKAGRLSLLGWLSISCPRLYLFACKSKERVTNEYLMVRRVGPRILASLIKSALSRSFKLSSSWRKNLPIQSVQRLVIPDLNLGSTDELLDYLDSTGVDYSPGGHTLYLPPASIRASRFQVLTRYYPHNAGIKIVKNPGRIDVNNYIFSDMTRGESLIHRKLTHTPRQLTLVANLMFCKDIGPRLYDLVELQCGDYTWTGYVLEHVEGRTPTFEECEAGLGRIRTLQKQGFIKILIPDNDIEEDFRCPSCNNNAKIDASGKFRYVDFQNFLLVDYDSYLKDAALKAARETHFGDENLLRGGRYLYQSVPGLSVPGKRRIEDRVAVLSQLMESAGVAVKDRLVLDIGCNIGMMMGQYLKLGARWCHGWDKAHVIPHAEKLLLALGCTRFSLSGGDIDKSTKLEADVPETLKLTLDGCAISYLAVRAHLEWLDSLAQIPWSFMIYEGHEDETEKDFKHHMEQLQSLVRFKVGAVGNCRDGDSDRRIIAILLK